MSKEQFSNLVTIDCIICKEVVPCTAGSMGYSTVTSIVGPIRKFDWILNYLGLCMWFLTIFRNLQILKLALSVRTLIKFLTDVTLDGDGNKKILQNKIWKFQWSCPTFIKQFVNSVGCIFVASCGQGLENLSSKLRLHSASWHLPHSQFNNYCFKLEGLAVENAR